jgi:hypothetical protein
MSRPLLPLLLAITVAGRLHAADGEQANAPATLQLPGWLQSLRADAPAGQPQGSPSDAATPAVLPSGGAEPAAPRVRQVADWNDPRPPSPTAATVTQAAAVTPTATTLAPPKPAAPASGFRRWISERVA